MQLREALDRCRFGSFTMSTLATVRVVSACEWEAVTTLLLYTNDILAKDLSRRISVPHSEHMPRAIAVKRPAADVVAPLLRIYGVIYMRMPRHDTCCIDTYGRSYPGEKLLEYTVAHSPPRVPQVLPLYPFCVIFVAVSSCCPIVLYRAPSL